MFACASIERKYMISTTGHCYQPLFFKWILCYFSLGKSHVSWIIHFVLTETISMLAYNVSLALEVPNVR
jgi:hypothetical protein